MNKQYERNIPAISETDQKLLSQKKVLVLGCGGLGGYVIESLARLGIGYITAIDGDVFEISNLNRQLYSTLDVIGSSKAEAAAHRVKSIAPYTTITAITDFFNKTNAEDLIKGQDVVIDALDNLSARLLMEDVCEKYQVPFVHGAILGWDMQITTGLPGKRILHKIYPKDKNQKISNNILKTSLSFTPAICASIETTEALKLLLNQKPSLAGKLFIFHLQTLEQLIIPLE